MTKSDQIGQLAAALAAAQAEYQAIEKDKKADIQSKTGRSFKYQYADLSDVLAALRPALSKHGVAIIQPVTAKGKDVVVTTLLAHKSGEWISEDMSLSADGMDPRALGSAISYARRYGLLAMAGHMPGGEDDDGEAAGVVEQRPHRAPPPPGSPQHEAAKENAQALVGAAALADVLAAIAKATTRPDFVAIFPLIKTLSPADRPQARAGYEARWAAMASAKTVTNPQEEEIQP